MEHETGLAWMAFFIGIFAGSMLTAIVIIPMFKIDYQGAQDALTLSTADYSAYQAGTGKFPFDCSSSGGWNTKYGRDKCSELYHKLPVENKKNVVQGILEDW